MRVCVRKKTLWEIKCCPKAGRSVISGKLPFMRTSANERVRLGFTCRLPCCFLSDKQIKLFATFLSYSFHVLLSVFAGWLNDHWLLP